MLDIQFYDLYADVDVFNGLLKANCGIRLKNQADGQISKVAFLLNRCLTVEFIKCIGRHAEFTQKLTNFKDLENVEINFIEVFFDEPLNPGDIVRLSINYNGKICDYQHVFRYVKDNVNEKFTLIRPDAYSYPIIGTLKFKESIPQIISQRFDYKLKIKVPKEYVVANIGRLINRIGFDDKVLYIYESKLPSWRIDIAVAKFKKITDTQNDLHVFVFEEDYEHAVKILNELKKVLKFYIDWFNHPPIWTGYTIIEIPNGWGSQADLAGMLLNSKVFRDPSEISGLYHEIAHLWYVKSGEKYVSRFFDEGLASYFQLLAEREFFGEEHFNKRLEQLREKFIKLTEENPKLLEVPISKYGEYMLTDASYYVGAYLLYVLHNLVGDEKFKILIKSLVKTFSKDKITLEAFKQLVTTICGEEYEVFIDEWIFHNKPAQYLKDKIPLHEIISRYKRA